MNWVTHESVFAAILLLANKPSGTEVTTIKRRGGGDADTLTLQCGTQAARISEDNLCTFVTFLESLNKHQMGVYVNNNAITVRSVDDITDKILLAASIKIV